MNAVYWVNGTRISTYTNKNVELHKFWQRKVRDKEYDNTVRYRK